MLEPSANAERTLAVLFGASEFAGVGRPTRESFTRSKDEFKQYLTSALRVPSENILDLFDSDLNFVDMGDRMEAHVTKWSAHWNAKSGLDLIFYYVGHGQRLAGEKTYLLLLKNSQSGDRLADLSFPINSFGNILRKVGAHHRKYVILDCCYSAAAADAFMSSSATEVLSLDANNALKESGKVQSTEQDRDAPQYGTVLLCASEATEPASAPLGHHLTMFSGALLQPIRFRSAGYSG